MRKRERESERERETETERMRESERETEIKREKESQKKRERQREKQRDRKTETESIRGGGGGGGEELTLGVCVFLALRAEHRKLIRITVFYRQVQPAVFVHRASAVPRVGHSIFHISSVVSIAFERKC